MYERYYLSLVKEHPPPTFGGSKFTQRVPTPRQVCMTNRVHSWSVEKHSFKHYAIWGKKHFMLHFPDGYCKVALHRLCYFCCTLLATIHHAHSDRMPFKVLWAVRTWLQGLWLHCVCLIIWFEGALSWLNHGAETVKSTHLPLWQTRNVLYVHPWVLFSN